MGFHFFCNSKNETNTSGTILRIKVQNSSHTVNQMHCVQFFIIHFVISMAGCMCHISSEGDISCKNALTYIIGNYVRGW